MRSLVLLVVIGCSAPSARAPRLAPPPPQPPVADPEPPGLRLPGDVRPTKIGLELTVIPDQPTVAGLVHIDARVVRPTTVVWLHAAGLTIERASLGGQQARVIAGGADVIGLVVPRELGKGAIAIEVAYTTAIDKARSQGIYSVTEGEGPDAATYAYTFFEPIDARRAFPCFDEPAYKVPWQLTFHVRREHVALGNAPVVRESDEPNGMKRVELADTKPLPSYLVAFVVGPFEVIDGGVAGRVQTPIRFIVPKGRAGELGWAKDVTPRVVAALEHYFDMAYPYGKLDVAVVPRYWGTMEHPGIVAMGQPLTLIRPDQATRSRKQAYANILAHELGHYWFGDLVTMLWWDDTWLNEALGEWLDMIITDAVEPAWRYRDRRVDIAAGAMAADETLSARAMRQPVTTPEGIAASFDNDITYFKGSSVFRMFEAWVGEATWRAFIGDYLRAHQWGNASAEDLLGAAKAKLGAPVEAGLRSFLEQPGVPRITAEPSCPAGQPARIELHQTRSLPPGARDSVERTWRVPVCVRYGDATHARAGCVQLDGADGELAVEGGCPSWILPNAGATGYYRSAIAPALARALLTPGSPIARVASPTPAERMMVVADLRAAIERDELAIDQLLALVPLIAADPDDVVARYAFAAAQLETSALDDALYAKAQRYYLRAFGPTARRLGWQRGAKDSDERHLLRRAALSAIAPHDPALARQAGQLADAWLAKRIGIEDDLVGAMLDTATYHGDAARFDQLLAEVRRARDRSEQQRLLRALGGFRDPALAAKALALVTGHELDLRETLGILYGVLGHRETRDLGLAFVTEHLDELLARMRADESTGMLGGLAGAFCDPDRRGKVEALVRPRAAKIDGAQVAVARGLEQSDQCIARVARQLPAIRKFLDRY